MPRFIVSRISDTKDGSSLPSVERQDRYGNPVGASSGGGVFFVTAEDEAAAKAQAASMLGCRPDQIRATRY